jgi:hypothetical protein
MLALYPKGQKTSEAINGALNSPKEMNKKN